MIVRSGRIPPRTIYMFRLIWQDRPMRRQTSWCLRPPTSTKGCLRSLRLHARGACNLSYLNATFVRYGDLSRQLVATAPTARSGGIPLTGSRAAFLGDPQRSIDRGRRRPAGPLDTIVRCGTKAPEKLPLCATLWVRSEARPRATTRVLLLLCDRTSPAPRRVA